jgi:spermidine/putrescine transport system substrate-binding protein
MTQRDDENDRRLAGLLAVGFSRREAMKMLAALGMTAAGAASFADSGLADTAQLTGPGGIALARPDQPVTLPLHGKAIESGLKPETGGTFRLFNYADYLDKKAMDDFGKKYGVTVELTSFDSMDQAITRLASHAVRPDVTNITPDRIAQAVAGKLLKPINLDYIPNLKKNIWPSLHSPFYDTGSQYTVPYTTYATGIGWRADKISEDIAKMNRQGACRS